MRGGEGRGEREMGEMGERRTREGRDEEERREERRGRERRKGCERNMRVSNECSDVADGLRESLV